MGQRIMIHTRDSILKFLTLLDNNLNKSAKLYLIGGGVATLYYDCKSGTVDLDSWNELAELQKALSMVKKNFPKDYIAINENTVSIESSRMRKRFKVSKKFKFKKLKIYIPEPEDFVLLKIQRADSKDIEDILELSKKVKLNLNRLIQRFKAELLRNNPGNDVLLKDKFLWGMSEIYGVSVAKKIVL